MRVIRLIKHYKNIQKTHFSKIRIYIFRNATDNRKLGGNCIKEETNLTDHLYYVLVDTRAFLTEFKFKEQQ